MNNFLASLGWLPKTFVLIIGFGFLPLFYTHFSLKGVKSEVIAFWWFQCTAIGILALSQSGLRGMLTDNISDFFTPGKSVIKVIAISLIVGPLLNVYYGQACSNAPNPALVPALIASWIAPLYLISVYGYRFFPNNFKKAVMDPVSFGCCILIFICFAVITFRHITSAKLQ